MPIHMLCTASQTGEFQPVQHSSHILRMTPRTSILNHVSSRPASFKLILRRYDTLTMPSHCSSYNKDDRRVLFTWWNPRSDDAILREVWCSFVFVTSLYLATQTTCLISRRTVLRVEIIGKWIQCTQALSVYSHWSFLVAVENKLPE
jgi:hypothetical protein